jgi:hypothetical protein
MSSLAVPLPFEIIDGKRMLKRSDLWRLGYRVQRYVSYLSIEELDERNKDIFANLTTLTPQGQISLPPIKGEPPFPWMELWRLIGDQVEPGASIAVRKYSDPREF